MKKNINCDEVLIRMDEKLSELQKDTKVIMKKLYGSNGDGVMVRLARNETDCKNLKLGLGLGFTVLGVLITIFNIV